MNNIALFIFNSILFGIGLSMDAFSVSCANGLAAPDMPLSKSIRIAGTFGIFQAVMPLIGWFCVHMVAEKFQAFQKFIPWIALGLLLYIGGNMLREGLSGHAGDDAKGEVGNGTLLIQGIATSIDALSVGFTIAGYQWIEAFSESVIIGFVTFVLSLVGIRLGKTLGTRLSGKAEILGGVILIGIGLKIFITGVFDL